MLCANGLEVDAAVVRELPKQHVLKLLQQAHHFQHFHHGGSEGHQTTQVPGSFATARTHNRDCPWTCGSMQYVHIDPQLP